MATLLLDLDGTLSNSFTAIITSFRAALRELGVPEPADVRYVAGPPMLDTMRGLGLSEEDARRGLELYLADQHAGSWALTSVFPGMKELLAQWKEQGYEICTATAKGEEFAAKTLDMLGLAEYIDFLGAAQEGYHAARRTKAEVINYVLTERNLDPAQCLMIGDRSHDTDGAAVYDIPTVLVTWGFGNEEEWNQARWVAHTPDELADIVEEWTASLR